MALAGGSAFLEGDGSPAEQGQERRVLEAGPGKVGPWSEETEEQGTAVESLLPRKACGPGSPTHTGWPWP